MEPRDVAFPTVTCPAGRKVLSGAASVFDHIDDDDLEMSNDVRILRSEPVGDDGWRGVFVNVSSRRIGVAVTAVCAFTN